MIRGGALLPRVGFALFVALGPLVLTDCLDAGGPSFVTLGVNVEPAPVMFGGLGGSGTIPQQIADVCVRLPVLLGSTVEKKQSVATGLSVSMNATRDGVTVTFPGADDGEGTRTYALEVLRRGVRETVALGVGADAYMASIATGCTNP